MLHWFSNWALATRIAWNLLAFGYDVATSFFICFLRIRSWRAEDIITSVPTPNSEDHKLVLLRATCMQTSWGGRSSPIIQMPLSISIWRNNAAGFNWWLVRFRPQTIRRLVCGSRTTKSGAHCCPLASQQRRHRLVDINNQLIVTPIQQTLIRYIAIVCVHRRGRRTGLIFPCMSLPKNGHFKSRRPAREVPRTQPTAAWCCQEPMWDDC